MLAGLMPFAIALTTTLVVTMPVRRFALQFGIVDQPNQRKIHQVPMPLLGGVAIYCGTVLAIISSLDGQPRAQIFGILAGATLLLVTGILDDRGLLHNQIKLFVAMPLAAATLVVLGIRFRAFEQLLPGGLGSIADIAFTMFWAVGVTAAFSILDHMDGLVSGVAAVASFFFGALAFMNGQVFVGTLAAAVFGGALGFLRWNFKPAKIFMGDGGAMFLGFMLSTLGLKLRLAHMQATEAWIIPVLVLAIPIFDTTLVTISRSRRGLIPFASPGKDHTAHRLANLRLGQRGAVLVVYTVGGLFGVVALVVSRSSLQSPLVFVTVLVFNALAAVAALERTPYQRQEPGKGN